nr:MAG: nucleoprotein [Sea turtle neural virus 1]WET19895.1 MAG: nucleoprotein [Sea turtle neural virus 1]
MWNWFRGGNGQPQERAQGGDQGPQGPQGGGQGPQGGGQGPQGVFGGGRDPAHEAMREMRRRMREGVAGLQAHNAPGWEGTVEAARMPARQNVIPFGPADNVETFEELARAGGGVLRSILRNLDVAPFTQQRVDGNNLGLDDLILAGHICSLRARTSQTRRLQLILEMLVPQLPVDMVVPQAEARAELIALLEPARLLAEPWFGTLLAAFRARHPFAAGNTLAGRFTDANVWRDQSTLEEKIEFLMALCGFADDRMRSRSLGVIILLLVSFATRGSISAAKLGRIVNDLNAVMPNIADGLTPGDVQQVWGQFGHYVDDRVMPGIMRRWLEHIPAAAIRLRVVLAQAAGSGLTTLDVIARAIHEHPHFPWPLIRRMYPDEWVNVGQAVAAVGGNPYFGYRRDLEVVRSTRFKRIGTVAGKLLIKFGDRTLENYRGFSEDQTNKTTIDRLIMAYVETHEPVDLNEAMSDTELEMHVAMRELVAAYPVNAGGLANMAGHPDPV